MYNRESRGDRQFQERSSVGNTSVGSTSVENTSVAKSGAGGVVPSETAEARRRSDRSLQLALAAARTAQENRGRDLVVLDMRGVTPIFDYFVIATGTSRRQLHAMSEEIDHALEEGLGDRRMSVEGYAESRWIVLDYGSLVVHLFDQETRDYYALEQLWSGARRVDLPERPAAS
jgi:ribosome-associated protein